MCTFYEVGRKTKSPHQLFRKVISDEVLHVDVKDCFLSTVNLIWIEFSVIGSCIICCDLYLQSFKSYVDKHKNYNNLMVKARILLECQRDFKKKVLVCPVVLALALTLASVWVWICYLLVLQMLRFIANEDFQISQSALGQASCNRVIATVLEKKARMKSHEKFWRNEEMKS